MIGRIRSLNPRCHIEDESEDDFFQDEKFVAIAFIIRVRS
jgi:hypothetical protein